MKMTLSKTANETKITQSNSKVQDVSALHFYNHFISHLLENITIDNTAMMPFLGHLSVVACI